MALVELNFFGTGWHMDTTGLYNMTLVELSFGGIIQPSVLMSIVSDFV